MRDADPVIVDEPELTPVPTDEATKKEKRPKKPSKTLLGQKHPDAVRAQARRSLYERTSRHAAGHTENKEVTRGRARRRKKISQKSRRKNRRNRK